MLKKGKRQAEFCFTFSLSPRPGHGAGPVFTVQDKDMLPGQGTFSYNADIVYILGINYTKLQNKIRCSHSVLKYSFQSNTLLFTIKSVFNVTCQS